MIELSAKRKQNIMALLKVMVNTFFASVAQTAEIFCLHCLVGVSLSNYRKIPKGSLLDEDSDSFDDDEWDKAHPDWDSFEVIIFFLYIFLNM